MAALEIPTAGPPNRDSQKPYKIPTGVCKQKQAVPSLKKGNSPYVPLRKGTNILFLFVDTLQAPSKQCSPLYKDGFPSGKSGISYQKCYIHWKEVVGILHMESPRHSLQGEGIPEGNKNSWQNMG